MAETAARYQNHKLALVALMAATGASPAGRKLCGRLLDGAQDLLSTATDEELGPCGGTETSRASALEELSQACAACGACPRGHALLLAMPLIPPALASKPSDRRA